MNKMVRQSSSMPLLMLLVVAFGIGSAAATSTMGNTPPAEVPLNLFTPAAGWTYAGGWEYPGAKGEFDLAQDG